MIFLDVGQYFAYKRYSNTIIGPWDLSRIVDNGRLYILIEYNVFWTGLARSGLVRTGPARVWPGVRPGSSSSWWPNAGPDPGRTGPGRTGPDRAGPSRTEPDRAGPSQIGPKYIIFSQNID